MYNINIYYYAYGIYIQGVHCTYIAIKIIVMINKYNVIIRFD